MLSLKTNLFLGFLIRAITLGTGAICNLGIANLLLKNHGDSFYATFALITSIPTLLPFAELGLGSTVFNIYVDREIDTRKERQTVQITSQIFAILCGTSLALLLLIVFFTHLNGWVYLLGIEPSSKLSMHCFLVCVFTLIAVPFSIGSKKLIAEDRVNEVLAIQGLMPIFSFACLLYLDKFEPKAIHLVYIIPAMSYFLTTVYLFLRSKIYENISLKNIYWKLSEVREYVSLGFWSLCFVSFYAYMWQVPRILFNNSEDQNLVVEYSLILLVLIPSISLLNVISSWTAPKARRLKWNAEKVLFLKETLKNSLVVTLTLSLLILSISLLAHKANLRYPSIQSVLMIVTLLFLTILWVVPSSALTNMHDFRWLMLRVLPLSLGCFSFVSLTQKSLVMLFVLYLLPISLGLILLNWRRVNNLNLGEKSDSD